jgi:hypothetical protein
MRESANALFVRNLARFLSLVVLACSANDPMRPPLEPKLLVATDRTTVVQGDFGLVVVKVVAPQGAGEVGVMVTGAPTGVTTDVLNLRTIGDTTTGTLRIGASGASTPGDYNLQLQGLQNSIPVASATIALTIAPDPSCPDTDVVCAQWAKRAVASTEYSFRDWAADQATGPSNVPGCDDHPLAWASVLPNGVDWLELEYVKSVVPTQVVIYEVYGTSSIVKVELKDLTGAYHTVYVDTPAFLACPRKLTIDVSTVQARVYAVRVSVDQRMVNSWDEIDAVQLIGKRN